MPGGPPLILRSPARTALAVALVPTLLAGCGGGSSGPLAVTPPRPGPKAAAFCGRLHDALPARLDRRAATPVSPSSPLTAAWGSPAVVLRCGVARPRSLRPTSETIEINNSVRWFLHETKGAYVFTTYGRAAYVEVSVPKSVPRDRATAPLVDLDPPVRTTVPTTDDLSQGP